MELTAIVTSPPSSGPVWLGDFGDGTLSQYRGLQAGDPSRCQILSDTPPPGLKYYARLTALNGDVLGVGNSPTTNPRCQLLGPTVLMPGETLTISGWTRFPVDFPTPVNVAGGQFFVAVQLYGPPWILGSPQLALDVNGTNFILSHPSGNIFQTPLVTGVWLRWRLVVKFSTDPAVGTVQLWYCADGTDNPVLQTLTGGVTTKTCQTLLTGQTVGVAPNPDNYWSLGLASSIVMDHAGFRIDAA